MRDIRADIKERLESVATKRERLQDALVNLDEQERMLQTLLTAENARFHSREPSLFGHITGAKPVETSISAFLIEAMSDGNNWPLERLKQLALEQGILSPDDGAIGRSLHGALIGLKRRDLAEIVESGVWKLKEKTIGEMFGKKPEAPA